MAQMTEAAQIERLREEQQKAVEQTKEKIEQLNKFKDDYEVLQNRLRTLPEKVSHEVMVPFGKLAFMPGRLVHTNEILVLLGDNWFVERSAKQACEIIDRRIENLDSTVDGLKKQQGLLKPRLDFTQQMRDMAEEQSDVVEIKEDYDPEKERKWKEEHRKRLRWQKQEERDIVDEREETKQISDEELWRRLDELELQESQRRELRNIPDEPAVSLEHERQVHWEKLVRPGQQDSVSGDESIQTNDEDYTDDDDDDDDDDSDDEEEEEEEQPRRPRTIHFSHSDAEPPSKVPPEDGSTSITSPADIAKQFTPDIKLKSILKKSSRPEAEQDPPAVLPSPVRSCQVSSKAFSSAVMEHSNPPVSTEPTAAPPKKVSRFKAQRMQKNR